MMKLPMPMRRQPVRISRHDLLLLAACLSFLCLFCVRYSREPPRTAAPASSQPSPDDIYDTSPSHRLQRPEFLRDYPRIIPKYEKPPPRPPITDPFPLLAYTDAAPPAVPPWNAPREGLHERYGLAQMPPLFIGFTHSWPMLLQTVVSYVTAGWPPESIIVVENTGVLDANRDGKLTLQNPFYLNHTTLARLGVRVARTPVRMTFSQLQNFFMYLAHATDHPYYFYSHQDVVVLSFEGGPDAVSRPGDPAWEFDSDEDRAEFKSRSSKAGLPGYRTIYENCLRELARSRAADRRWAVRMFQSDHLALVNRAALEAVGGYDVHIPYDFSDCDVHARLQMDGWTLRPRRAGIVIDVSTALDDLLVLYRDPAASLNFTDPSPAGLRGESLTPSQQPPLLSPPSPASSQGWPFEVVRDLATRMGEHRARGDVKFRNTWQVSQHGGQDEPFSYDPRGLAEGIERLNGAGQTVFAAKWGYKSCDLVDETALVLEDQWRVLSEGERREGGF